MKRKKLHYHPEKSTDINITIPVSNSNPMKWNENIFIFFYSSPFAFMLVNLLWFVSTGFTKPVKTTQNQFTIAIQKEIHFVSGLHISIIWAKCKVKESNCISPDSPNAILYYNKWFLGFLENLGPGSFITHSKIFWDLGFNSKSCQSKLSFQIVIA